MAVSGSPWGHVARAVAVAVELGVLVAYVRSQPCTDMLQGTASCMPLSVHLPSVVKVCIALMPRLGYQGLVETYSRHV